MNEFNIFENPGYLSSDFEGTHYRVAHRPGTSTVASYAKKDWEVTVTFKRRVIAGHYLPAEMPLDDDMHTKVQYWSVEQINDFSAEEFYQTYRRVEVKEV